MGKPLCLIYSDDGFDQCVLFNLMHLYKTLGFLVTFSNRVIDCNLLVIIRGSSITLPDYFDRNIPIHVYNYVGNDITNILGEISENPYFVIAPSQDLLDFNQVDSDRGVIAFPPVYTQAWISQARRTSTSTYPLVHIGNRKKTLGALSDPYAKALETLTSSGRVDVWGRGWRRREIAKGKYHGYVEVFNIKHIYCRTEIALGLLYPFQRKLGTFSGRFWQAPLNGAMLLSEANRFIGVIPGVYETDLVNIDLDVRRKYSRDDIADASICYWNQVTAKVERDVERLLDKAPPTEEKPNLNSSWLVNRSLYRGYRLKAELERLVKFGASI